MWAKGQAEVQGHWLCSLMVIIWRWNWFCLCSALQVPEWHRLMALSWACLARQTPHLREQKQRSPSLFCKLTTAPSRGSLQEFSSARPEKHVQEPEYRTRLVQCLHEKQKTCVDPETLESEKVISSLQDMGFAEAHINSLLSIQPSVHPRQLLDIISELLLLGLNPEPVFNALKKNPQLLKLSTMQMKRRSSYLRKLGLGEGTRSSRLYREESELRRE